MYISSGRTMTQCFVSLVLNGWTSPSCPLVYFSHLGQQRSFSLIWFMLGSRLYEWMNTFILKGVVKLPKLGTDWVTCSVIHGVASCLLILNRLIVAGWS